MLKTFLGWFSGPLGKITDTIGDLQKAKIAAANDSERMEIDAQIKELTARQGIIIAEQSNWITRMIRPLFALPFVIYNFKLVVWDKVLGLGTTDPLSDQLWQIEMIVIGAYCIGRSGEKIASIVRR